MSREAVGGKWLVAEEACHPVKVASRVARAKCPCILLRNAETLTAKSLCTSTAG